ncbi:hypothetical protein [Priestia megaterium]|uniref:hypothetical protein n=1 Tax=Priestia megaterium TaxID=1404 RepID=UPI00406BCE74
MRKLRDSELVSERRKGHWIFYSLNKENSYYQFVLDILDSLPSEDERLKELEKQDVLIVANNRRSVKWYQL